jgi:TolA-binding protein
LKAAPAVVAAVFAAGIAVGAVELTRSFVRSGAQVVAPVAPPAPAGPAPSPAVGPHAGMGLRAEAPQATPAPAVSDAPVSAPVASAPPPVVSPAPAQAAPQAPLSDRPARPEPPAFKGRSVDTVAAPTLLAPQTATGSEVGEETLVLEGAGTTAGPTAQQLFSQANGARMRGDPAEAVVLLRQLERSFPMSSEAAAGHLSLGMLLLQGGQPAPALDELRSYRAQGGAMVPEALWGESQALRELGRSDEERTTLQNLLGGYPTSAYAAAARKRLAELP